MVAAVAAVATFVYAGGLIGRDDPTGGPSAGSTPRAGTSDGGGSRPGPGPTTTTTPPPPPPPLTESRDLFTITPASGVDALSVVRGQPAARQLACPSNQGGDRDRSVRWDLAGSWERLTMVVTVSGRADPDTRSQLEVFAGSVRVYNNAQLTLGSGRVAVAADVSSSRVLTVRLTCESAAMAIALSAPTLTRER